MHHIFNDFTSYGILLLTLVLLASFFGCDAQNPVCSDNFCVVGEVFLRSDLDANQEFSEVDVNDSVIFATLIGTTPVETTPVEPTVDDSVSLSSVVADVAAGGTTYAGKIITITAEVEFDASIFDDNDAITLVTNDDDVWFFILSDETPARLANYEEGKSYTFNLFIQQITPPELLSPEYKIWSNIPLERVSADMSTIVADVIAGGRDYIDKIVDIQATIDHDTTTFTTSDTITLETNNDAVVFFVSNITEEVVILDEYEKGSTYQFSVFIEDIDLNSVTSAYNIRSHIVVE